MGPRWMWPMAMLMLPVRMGATPPPDEPSWADAWAVAETALDRGDAARAGAALFVGRRLHPPPRPLPATLPVRLEAVSRDLRTRLEESTDPGRDLLVSILADPRSLGTLSAEHLERARERLLAETNVWPPLERAVLWYLLGEIRRSRQAVDALPVLSVKARFEAFLEEEGRRAAREAREAAATRAREMEAYRETQEREAREREKENLREEAARRTREAYANDRRRRELRQQLDEIDEKIREIRSRPSFDTYVAPDGTINVLPADKMRDWREENQLKKRQSALRLELYQLR